MRGILAAAVLLSATVAVPGAPAAGPSGYVVYELVRHKPGGAAKLQVSLHKRTDGTPSIAAFMAIAPDKQGYAARYSWINQYRTGEEGYSTYGDWPVPPVACPTDCAPVPGGPYDGTSTLEVALEPGIRLFVAGMRGRFRVTVSDPKHWRVKPASNGFRVVTKDQADAWGMTWRGESLERFRSASAPGGRYGSMVYGQVPCRNHGVGSATLSSTNGAEGWGISCGPSQYDDDFADSPLPGTWSLKGEVVGDYRFPYRLVVFDYPKR